MILYLCNNASDDCTTHGVTYRPGLAHNPSVGVLTSEVLDVLVLVARQVAVDSRLTDGPEVWSQTTDAVLGDICQKLVAGTPKTKHLHTNHTC